MPDFGDIEGRTIRIFGTDHWDTAGVPRVLTVGDNAPPGSPSPDDCHIIGTAGSGAWAGHNNAFTRYNGSGWDFFDPSLTLDQGWMVRNAADNKIYHLGASGWTALAVASTDITDSSAWGRSVITAADQAAGRALVLPGAERIWFCDMPFITVNTSLTLTSGRVYWSFMGRGAIRKGTVINYINIQGYSTPGSGTQVGEYALYSTPLPPNHGFSQTPTLIASGDDWEDMTSYADPHKRNATALAHTLADDTYVYAALRFAMSSLQPRVIGATYQGPTAYIGGYMGVGQNDSLGDLTALSTFTMTQAFITLPLIWISTD